MEKGPEGQKCLGSVRLMSLLILIHHEAESLPGSLTGFHYELCGMCPCNPTCSSAKIILFIIYQGRAQFHVVT